MSGKGGAAVDSGPVVVVVELVCAYAGFINGNKRVVKATEGVNITHHARRTMHEGEVVAQEFLGKATNLMNGTGVFKEFLHGIAVTKPVEVGSPKITAILADGPTAGDGFTDEGVEVVLAISAFARPKADRAQASSCH
jgi:hypothetical protein